MPTRPFRTIAPGRLEVREGGGCMTIFGAPFLIGGLFLMGVAVGLIPLESRQSVFLGPAIALFSLPFTVIGAGLALGRAWWTFSSVDRTVVKQIGLLVPMKSTSYRVDDYSAVLLGFVRGDSDTADQYPVSLKARNGADLSLFGSSSYAEARQRATAIATLFHFDIEDSSTAHSARLTAAQADMSFQHRRRLEHQRDEPVARPASLRSEVRDQSGTLTITIPARQWPAVGYLFFLIPIAVPVLMVGPLSEFFRDTRTPDAVSWAFRGFLVVAFGVLPAWSALSALLKSRRGRTIVSVSSGGVRIDERGAWTTRTVATFPVSDVLDVDYDSAPQTIEEIRRRRPSMNPPPVGPGTERFLKLVSRLGGGGKITLKTRQGITTFGEGLDDEELRYLHYLVRRALVQ